MNKLVDLSLGINSQAYSVLHLLDREPDFAEYNEGYYQIRTKTRPWYNGRESGFVISMDPNPTGTGNVIHIAFFEHRNSDSICALRWVTTGSYFNHPLEDESIFDIAYGGKSKTKWDVSFSVGYGESGKMAEWIYSALDDFYKQHHNQT